MIELCSGTSRLLDLEPWGLKSLHLACSAACRYLSMLFFPLKYYIEVPTYFILFCTTCLAGQGKAIQTHDLYAGWHIWNYARFGVLLSRDTFIFSIIWISSKMEHMYHIYLVSRCVTHTFLQNECQSCGKLILWENLFKF